MLKWILILCFLSISSFAAISDFNFAVVVNNANYKIYRSSALGKAGLADLETYLKKNQMPMPKTIIYMNDEGYKSGFFVEDFALQEYALQDKMGFRFFHSYDYKQRTYLDGHDPYNPSEDIDLKNNLNSEALKLFGPNPKDGKDGGTDALKRILDLVLDPNNQPVLFHCMGGKHRTGMVGMIVRYIQSEKAKETVSSDSVYKSLAEVEYKKHAGSSSREENVYFVRKYIQTPAFNDYVSRYRNLLQ